MLSLYTGKVLESRTSGLLMLVLFAVLYGLLYLILTLEDYALLAGALLGFAALTAVMFATLRVDWSGLGARAVEIEAPNTVLTRRGGGADRGSRKCVARTAPGGPLYRLVCAMRLFIRSEIPAFP